MSEKDIEKRTDITFGAALTQDVPQLVELLKVLFGIEQDFHADPEKQSQGLQRLISESERGVVMTARDGSGKIIGMVSAQLVVSTAEGAYSAWVEDMVIDEAWRAKGIGRKLLESALAWARSRGATRAQLLVDLDNAPALGYYDHLGWQATRLGARRLLLKSDA
jgi:GNAT superfamily N-acetyltransferase